MQKPSNEKMQTTDAANSNQSKNKNSLYFCNFLVNFLHDLPLFNFESLMTDQFLHFTNLNRVQIAISFRSKRETPQSNDRTVSYTLGRVKY